MELKMEHLIVAVVVILLIVLLSPQITYLLSCLKNSVVSLVYGKKLNPVKPLLPDEDVRAERLEDKITDKDNTQANASDTLRELGYTGDLPWDQVIQATELDPATFSNHQEFVKDVRRFSSGANFTSVTDDNTNAAYVNFVGLRRPEHVAIGADARQTPDVDETVLQRNKVFRWNSTS